MTKSLAHALEGYVVACFQDMLPTYRSDSDWERDLQRSLHELAIRGERFLTIDLPAVRKHLEWCLEQEMYIAAGVFLTAPKSCQIVVPAYLGDLYLQIFTPDGKLRSTPNERAIADIRQWCECFGKLKHPCKQEYIDDEVQNFIANENDLRSPTLNWVGDSLHHIDGELLQFRPSFDDLRHGGQDNTGWVDNDGPTWNVAHEHRTLQKVCDAMISQLGDFSQEEAFELPRHGKGRVSNLPRNRSKYDFTSWPAKLDLMYPFDYYACTDLGVSVWSDPSSAYSNSEHPSKLIAVPKTMSGPRLIASEPNYYQWIQQLILNQLNARYKKTDFVHCVSFDDQNPNRELALRGSVDRTVSTVDLKSASDRLSCWTIERALAGNQSLLERIHASRSRMIKGSKETSSLGYTILRKCFSQGNACTFPVQSLVYAMISIAAVLITEGSAVTPRSITRAAKAVRVFGDDIVVPTTSLRKLTEILTALQLKVNSNKTFSNGRFRESCGLDAYNGVNVTPARIKRFSVNPSHEVAYSMLDSSNNLFQRGMWHTAIWLQSYLDNLDLPVKAIREGHPCDSGALASFCGDSTSHLRKRWNSKYHCYEYRYHRLVSKAKRCKTQSAHDLSEFLWQKAAKRFHPLSYLTDSGESQIGVVDSSSAVMQRGWSTLY